MMITITDTSKEIINFANEFLSNLEEDKKVYNNLKDAICKGDDTRGILKNCTTEEIINFLCANNGEGDPLIVKAIKNIGNIKDYEEVLKEIYSQIYSKKDKGIINYANKILQDKALEDLMNSDGSIARKIIKFAITNHSNWDIFSIVTIKNGLYETVKKGDVDLAVKIYTTCKDMYESNYFILHRLFIMNANLKEAVVDIERDGKIDSLKSILMFAKETGKLKDCFNANVYLGKNLLQFAAEKGVGEKVNKIITECEIDLEEYLPSSTLSQFNEHEYKENDNHSATALPSTSLQGHDIAYPGRAEDKMFYETNNNYNFHEFSDKHGGKIAMVVTGVMLAPVGVAILFAMGNLKLGISLIILASIMVVIPILALTTNKGEELWNKVSDKLSNVFTCKSPKSMSVKNF